MSAQLGDAQRDAARKLQQAAHETSQLAAQLAHARGLSEMRAKKLEETSARYAESERRRSELHACLCVPVPQI